MVFFLPMLNDSPGGYFRGIAVFSSEKEEAYDHLSTMNVEATYMNLIILYIMIVY
ncbi:MAG: hypothetical protein ACJ71K_22635 [Nitrososphaeraceae archaeon]